MDDSLAPESALTIPRLVFRAAERYGDAPALEDGDIRLSFRELETEALRAARAFIAAGVEPGDRVGIWAPNVAEWIFAAIGLQCAGGVLVTLNTRFKAPEAGYVLRKSRAKLVCTMTEFLGTDYVAAVASQDLPDLEGIIALRGESGAAMQRGGGAAGVTGWEAFLAAGEGVSEAEARARAEAVDPDDLSDFIFTSGTTGNPKAVMTAHGQNVRVFATWTEVVGLRAGDRYLVVNPFFHSFGYKAGWMSAIMRGATIIPHLVFDAAEVLERVAKEKISMLPGPPTLYQSFLASPQLGDTDLSSLRLAVTGAAPTPVELIHRMRDELGFETIITGYGLTETCGVVTMCRFDDDPETIATTSGRAIPDVEVCCVDTDGKEVPRGEPGEIVVRGYNLMQGYFDDTEETRKTIDADGWLHTGDIAVMDEHGYVRITDRIKDMFINGGFNVYPAEIENTLYGSGQFAQVAVIGVPDERAGEVGMAFVVPAPDHVVTPDSVIAWCRENMANYKVPRRIAVVDELPTTPSGKVMKFKLREQAEAQ
ncbi:MAG: fatty acid--CoA ligase family protein [Deltaproteobacteria bacterium]|nr:fatty acid--CoA ligase family protein [Deltaproteobacteria bacterium]MBW2359411.1 fatty acid--CoA ligase family protein [Deltaproteobacteria bacterium]